MELALASNQTVEYSGLIIGLDKTDEISLSTPNYLSCKLPKPEIGPKGQISFIVPIAVNHMSY
jgi:hypothetical protein